MCETSKPTLSHNIFLVCLCFLLIYNHSLLILSSTYILFLLTPLFQNPKIFLCLFHTVCLRVHLYPCVLLLEIVPPGVLSSSPICYALFYMKSSLPFSFFIYLLFCYLLHLIYLFLACFYLCIPIRILTSYPSTVFLFAPPLGGSLTKETYHIISKYTKR